MRTKRRAAAWIMIFVMLLGIWTGEAWAVRAAEIQSQDGTVSEEEIGSQDGMVPEEEIGSQDSTVPEEEIGSQDSTVPEEKIGSQDGTVSEQETGSLDSAASEEILSMLYVEPQEQAGEAGQLIALKTAPEAGVLENAVLYYRDTSGEEVSVQATEISGSYAVFLMKGQGISQDALTRIKLVLDGSEKEILYREYGSSDEVVAAEIVETSDVQTVGAAQALSEEESDQAEAYVAGESNQITEKLAMVSGAGYRAVGRSKASGDVIICLDPGHGGSDSGACRTFNGVDYIEKDITLKISKYTKKELEKYEGVTVYLTRTTDEYVGLSERVEYADSKNATAFISQHINSTNSNMQYNVTGAMVFVSKGQYRPEMTKNAHKLAYRILDELEKAGFKNMDIIFNLSTNGSTYPNGALADYYTVIEESVRVGIPGMIVEHGFVNNPEDCYKFYGSNSKIKKIGQADARAIADFYGLKLKDGEDKPDVKTGWEQVNGKWVYLKSDGSKTVGWAEIEGKTYYFDTAGCMVSGKVKIQGTDHYFRDNGEVMSGVQTIGKDTVQLDKRGVIVMNPAGSWVLSKGIWYLKKTDGKYATGWISYNGKKCYLDKKGRMQKGITKVGGKYYYFSINGYMKKGTVKVGRQTYYLSASGAALTGNQVINNKKVYLNSKGQIVPDKWVSTRKRFRYQYGSGSYAKNKWVTSNGKRYYLDKKGYMKTGWFQIGSTWYYTNSSGVAVTGWITTNPKWYFIKRGKMLTKTFVKTKGGWYYLGNAGVMYSSRKAKIDGKTYRFDASGRCLNK